MNRYPAAKKHLTLILLLAYSRDKYELFSAPMTSGHTLTPTWMHHPNRRISLPSLCPFTFRGCDLVYGHLYDIPQYLILLGYYLYNCAPVVNGTTTILIHSSALVQSNVFNQYPISSRSEPINSFVPFTGFHPNFFARLPTNLEFPPNAVLRYPPYDRMRVFVRPML